MGGLVPIDLRHIAREFGDLVRLTGRLATSAKQAEPSDDGECDDFEAQYSEHLREQIHRQVLHLSKALNDGETESLQCSRDMRRLLSVLFFHIQNHLRVVKSPFDESAETVAFHCEGSFTVSGFPAYFDREATANDLPTLRYWHHNECLTRKHCVDVLRGQLSVLVRAIRKQERRSPPIVVQNLTKSEGPDAGLMMLLGKPQQRVVNFLWDKQAVPFEELAAGAWPKKAADQTVRNTICAIKEILESRFKYITLESKGGLILLRHPQKKIGS